MGLWGGIKQAGRWVDKNVTKPVMQNQPGPLGDAYRDREARNAKTREQKRAQEQADRWAGEYGDWRSRWNDVNSLTDAEGNRTRTGQRFDELSGLYTGEVDRGMYDASGNSAREYARRGMSDSGYAVGSQSDIISMAAAARAAAREMAMKEAVGEGMQVGMGELGAIGAQAGIAMGPQQMALEQAYREWSAQQQDEENQRNQYMQIMASLFGGATGGAAGGAAGSKSLGRK